jgi:hypothetical protein
MRRILKASVSMTRVVVFGGRHFDDVATLWRVLDDQHASTPFSFGMDGASDDVTRKYIGADFWAWQWGLARRIPWKRFHAEWSRLGVAAGPIRNKRMRDEGRPDLGIAFPGGKGTASMAGLLHEAGIEVINVAQIRSMNRSF